MSRYSVAGPYDIKAGDLASYFHGPIGAVACLGKLLALSGAGIQGSDLLVAMRGEQDQHLTGSEVGSHAVVLIALSVCIGD